MDRDVVPLDGACHNGSPETKAQHGLQGGDGVLGGHPPNGQVADAIGKSSPQIRGRLVIRRATLICLGVTLLPLIVVAALLARGQLDNAGAVSQAQTNEREALTTLSGFKVAAAQDQAPVSFTLSQINQTQAMLDQTQATLAAQLKTGEGPLIRQYQAQITNFNTQIDIYNIRLQAYEKNLAAAQARVQNASQEYAQTQNATLRAESQLGNPLSHWIIYAGAVGAVLVGDTLFILYLHGDRERDLENRAIVQSIAESTAQLEVKSTDLADLWLANEKQLAGYHQLILNYAATSRATTKFSLWFGFVFVAVISVCVLFTHSLATTIASSVIATIGTAVTGYIGRTVLRNSETSSAEVIEFFLHPIETQRLLTARQLIETMPEEVQGHAKLLLVKELVRARNGSRTSEKRRPSKRR